MAVLLEPRVPIAGFASLDPSRLEEVTRSIAVNDENGDAVTGRLYGADKLYTPLSDLPAFVPEAFVAIEDKRFYSHRGVDYIRVLAAAKNNILSGGFSEGASTITQQLIKNTHLRNDKTISRKIQEIRIARDLERRYPKDKILETYLNVLYFGSGGYGIGSAALSFFDKPANKLTLAEGALLAGMINNPARFDPRVDLDAAIKRRNVVLDRMYDRGSISAGVLREAKDEVPLVAERRPTCDQYTGSCLTEAARLLGKEVHELFSEGYTINSYMDPVVQDLLNKIVASDAPAGCDANIIVATNEDGRFIANAGNSYLNLSMRARSPGSTIKPILCYAPALELKNVYTCTPVLDERISFDGWSPANYNDEYFGWVSVEESLVRSLNIPAVKLLEANGIEKSKAIARRFGIEFDRRDDTLALALGGMTKGVTLNSLVDAYRVFANGGRFSKGKYIENIVDKNGNIIYSAPPAYKTVAISADTAYLVTDMLKKCAQKGTARHVGYSGTNAAAKTGTVGSKQGNTDAYCIAYTPHYTVAAWIGAREGLMDNGYSGGTVPAKMVKKVLSYLGDREDFTPPETIIRAQIDLNELKKNRKVLLAGDAVKDKDRLGAMFSSAHMPRAYSTPSNFLEGKTALDEFDNFRIEN